MKRITRAVPQPAQAAVPAKVLPAVAEKISAPALLVAPIRRSAAEIIREWFAATQASAPPRHQLDFALHVESQLEKLIKALDGR